MHPGKCVQQHLNALVVHEPSHKQHTHRFRILLYLPQDGLAFHAPVRLHVNAVRDNAAFFPELGQKRRTGDVSLCRRNDAVRTAQEFHQQWLIKPEQCLLPHHIAVPGDHHAATIAGQQARQICQRKRHVEFHHVCPLRHLPEFPQKGKGQRTGKVCAEAGRIVYRYAFDYPVLALPLFLADQNFHLCTLLQLPGKRPHQAFNAADVGIIRLVDLQNMQLSLLTHGKPPDRPHKAALQSAPR